MEEFPKRKGDLLFWPQLGAHVGTTREPCAWCGGRTKVTGLSPAHLNVAEAISQPVINYYKPGLKTTEFPLLTVLMPEAPNQDGSRASYSRNKNSSLPLLASDIFRGSLAGGLQHFSLYFHHHMAFSMCVFFSCVPYKDPCHWIWGQCEESRMSSTQDHCNYSYKDLAPNWVIFIRFVC